ncbi:MAG: hypothetical protein U9Q30_09510 [Campylobacterota bacterium]|nr:hypothetical protein [Campylobacterota bacterium]
MLKKIVLTLGITASLFGKPFQVNDTIKDLTLKDQFEKSHSITDETKMIIVSFEKDPSALVNEFLSKKKENFANKNNTLFVGNISKMPWIISKMFAIPRMKEYNYNLMLINDEDDDRFKHKENKLTIYYLEDKQIKNISFISTEEELIKLFK